MSYPVPFTSFFLLAPEDFIGDAMIGLSPTNRNAFRLFHQREFYDFSTLDDPRSLTFGHIAAVDRAMRLGNAMPSIAVFQLFRDAIAWEMDTLFSERMAQSLPTLLNGATHLAWLGVRNVCSREHVSAGEHIPYDEVVQEIRHNLRSLHKAIVERAYLTLHEERLRSGIHRAVNHYRDEGFANPVLKASVDLDIDYAETLRMLSMAGEANPDAVIPRSSIPMTRKEFRRLNRFGRVVLHTDDARFPANDGPDSVYAVAAS
jgi:hypothetical protein